MRKIAPVHYIMLLCVFLASCTATHTLPPFSSQRWHVDPRSGNAVSTSGVELGFGSEWMVTDTTLMQTPAVLVYPSSITYDEAGRQGDYSSCKECSVSLPI